METSSIHQQDNNLVKNAQLIEYPKSMDDISNWTIPKVLPNEIYHIGMWDFSSKMIIKTIEQTFQIDGTPQTLKLLRKEDIEKYKKKYQFLHIGMIQVAFKPLTLLGNNTSLMSTIRDGRCNLFKESLAAVVETSLCHGPVYFNCVPNLSLSLTDKNLYEALKLNIITSGYDFIPGSEVIAISYRLHFKVLNTLAPKNLIDTQKGHTTLVYTNLETIRIATNRLISWNEINFPESWSLEEAIPTQPVVNRNIDQIIQMTDGSVEIMFNNSTRKVKIPEIGRSMSSRSFDGYTRPSTSRTRNDETNVVEEINMSFHI